jgi:hypothetical protein
LGADADREKADATAVRQQLSLMQQERDDAVAQVTQMTVSLKEKERLAVQVQFATLCLLPTTYCILYENKHNVQYSASRHHHSCFLSTDPSSSFFYF